MALTTFPSTMLGSVAGAATGANAAALALAAANASTLTDVADVYGERNRQDSGGIDDVPGDNFVGRWPCLITKGRAYKEDMRTGEAESLTTFLGLFPLEADIRGSDTIRANGQAFEVVADDRGLSNPVFLSVQLTKII